MRSCGARTAGLVLGLAGWGLYALLELRHFYDTAVRVSPTQRVVRQVKELRLPRLYFCPADRGRAQGFKWHSFECLLTYKADHTSCPARLQEYRDRTPDQFRGQRPGDKGGECLEFGTHMIGVRQEWSAAWNEITLRAAFIPPKDQGVANALQEVELGYLPAEWMIGSRSSTVQRFYYPMLRVPIFFLDRGAQGFGVATRAYLGKEVDRGRANAGRYWYTYGAMQLAVENATMPPQSFMGASFSEPARVGVVHVVITLEDFVEYDFLVVSALFPFLGILGQIAGVGALVGVLVARQKGSSRGSKCADASGGPSGADVAGSSGFSADYEEAAGSERAEEEQSLLGAEAPKERARKHDDETASQALLGGEAGGDGL